MVPGHQDHRTLVVGVYLEVGMDEKLVENAQLKAEVARLKEDIEILQKQIVLLVAAQEMEPRLYGEGDG